MSTNYHWAMEFQGMPARRITHKESSIKRAPLAFDLTAILHWLDVARKSLTGWPILLPRILIKLVDSNCSAESGRHGTASIWDRVRFGNGPRRAWKSRRGGNSVGLAMRRQSPNRAAALQRGTRTVWLGMPLLLFTGCGSPPDLRDPETLGRIPAQDSVTPGRRTNYSWADDTDEGRAYVKALEADKEAGRLFPPIDSNPHLRVASENAAQFFAWWWAGEGLGEVDREDLCRIAVARCQFMEDHFGPRPDGYP